MRIWSTLRALFAAGHAVVVGLSEEEAGHDPIALFGRWFQAAEKGGLLLPEAAALGTATSQGRPSVRFVLLKGYDRRGFVFFTNYQSRKAQEMDANPWATLVFHWALPQRQVRIEGPVARISTEESRAYFRTRPRGSQLGAWASEQSRPLSSRRELENRVKSYEAEFRGKEVSLPPFWGGYRLAPESLEFWQGRANRLHDRILFVREGEDWARSRLYP